MGDFFGGIAGLAFMAGSFFAWMTALVQSASHDAWVLFVTSLIIPPWGVLVGVGYWLGII